jgi:predicted phage terminase large subunit-like protein
LINREFRELVARGKQVFKNVLYIKYSKDFMAFARDILGYTDFKDYPHGELVRFIDGSSKQRALVLMPRGSFKSTLITVAYTIWKVTYNPDIRVLIKSETYANAIKYLGQIKEHFERNEKYIDIYGRQGFKGGEERWTNFELTVSSRKKNLREPTFMCAGIDVPRVGMHYDMIINDDLHSDQNTQNSDQIDKVINDYKLSFSILEPDGKSITIGTRWDNNDLYGHILENEKDYTDVYFKSAGGRHDPSGAPLLLPERLTQAFLDTQRNTQSTRIYASQYNNDPSVDEGSPFKLDDLQYYNNPPENMRITMTVDPAVSEVDTADNSAIIVAGTDEHNNLYVLEAWQGHVGPKDLIDKIFFFFHKWHPKIIGVEFVSLAQFLHYALVDEMRRGGVFLPLQELKGYTKESKSRRIMALEPRWRMNSIYVKRDMTVLIDQAIKYPRTRHDDLMDALAYQLEIIARPLKAAVPDTSMSKLSQNEKAVYEDMRKTWDANKARILDEEDAEWSY